MFGGATFQRDVAFEQATFHGDAWLHGATFQRARQLGPMLVRKSLVLDEAVFHERARIEVAAAAMLCRRARFLAGVQLRVRWAQVVLDDADLAAPSILTGGGPFPDLDEYEDDWALEIGRQRRDHLGEPPARASLRSLITAPPRSLMGCVCADDGCCWLLVC